MHNTGGIVHSTPSNTPPARPSAERSLDNSGTSRRNPRKRAQREQQISAPCRLWNRPVRSAAIASGDGKRRAAQPTLNARATQNVALHLVQQKAVSRRALDVAS